MIFGYVTVAQKRLQREKADILDIYFIKFFSLLFLFFKKNKINRQDVNYNRTLHNK